MNPNERALHTAETAHEIEAGKQLESFGNIPIKVNDLRDPSSLAFDVDKFLNAIERLRNEGLYKITKDFKASDYGKYMSTFASAESDNWADAVGKASAIEITLTTIPNRGITQLQGRTLVEVKVLMNDSNGRVFRFEFKDGNYHSGGWDDVYLERRLGNSGAVEDFSLEPAPVNKKLE